MTVQYRTPPNYNEPLIDKGNTSSAYYRFFQALDQGVPPAGEVSVTVGASPFTYTAQHGGNMYVIGGNATSITFVRTTAIVTPWTEGIYPLSLGDQLIVTYTIAPTMFFVPT